MSYKLTNGEVIINLTTGQTFPKAVGNRHYEEYLQWLAVEGNTPLPADPIPPDEPQIAKVGAKDWFDANSATKQIFTLTIPELEAEVSALVDALLPLATAANRTKEKKIRMAQLVVIRMLVRRELT